MPTEEELKQQADEKNKVIREEFRFATDVAKGAAKKATANTLGFIGNILGYSAEGYRPTLSGTMNEKEWYDYLQKDNPNKQREDAIGGVGDWLDLFGPLGAGFKGSTIVTAAAVKHFDKAKALKYKDMVNKGANWLEAWKETGYFDTFAVLKGKTPRLNQNNWQNRIVTELEWDFPLENTPAIEYLSGGKWFNYHGKLGEGIDLGPLAEAYPQMKDWDLSILRLDEVGLNGQFVPPGKNKDVPTIILNLEAFQHAAKMNPRYTPLDFARQTLAHEVVHGVQWASPLYGQGYSPNIVRGIWHLEQAMKQHAVIRGAKMRDQLGTDFLDKFEAAADDINWRFNTGEIGTVEELKREIRILKDRFVMHAERQKLHLPGERPDAERLGLLEDRSEWIEMGYESYEPLKFNRDFYATPQFYQEGQSADAYSIYLHELGEALARAAGVRTRIPPTNKIRANTPLLYHINDVDPQRLWVPKLNSNAPFETWGWVSDIGVEYNELVKQGKIHAADFAKIDTDVMLRR